MPQQVQACLVYGGAGFAVGSWVQICQICKGHQGKVDTGHGYLEGCDYLQTLHTRVFGKGHT